MSPEQHVAAIPGVTSAEVTGGRMLVTVDAGLDATTVALRAAIVINALGAGLPVEVTGGRRTPPPVRPPTAARWAGLSMTNAARVACGAVLAGSAGLAAISDISAPLGPTPALLAGPPIHRRAAPPSHLVVVPGTGATSGQTSGVAPEQVVSVVSTTAGSTAPTVRFMASIRRTPAAVVAPRPIAAATPTPAVTPRAVTPEAPVATPAPVVVTPTPTPAAPVAPVVAVSPPQVIVASAKPPTVTGSGSGGSTGSGTVVPPPAPATHEDDEGAGHEASRAHDRGSDGGGHDGASTATAHATDD